MDGAHLIPPPKNAWKVAGNTEGNMAQPEVIPSVNLSFKKRTLPEIYSEKKSDLMNMATMGNQND